MGKENKRRFWFERWKGVIGWAGTFLKVENTGLTPVDFLPLVSLFLFMILLPTTAKSQVNTVTGAKIKSLDFFTKAEISDENWLTFARRFGITDGEIQEKSQIIKSELGLTQEQGTELETLISKLEDEESIATTLDHEENVEETQPGPVKKNPKVISELKQKLQIAQPDSINEVNKFRSLLGYKDLDFRFWLFEESIIYDSEWGAYSKNHNYSPGELVNNVVGVIQKSMVLEAFKKIKMDSMSSSQAVDKYFEIRMNLVRKRVLFQNFRYRNHPGSSKDFQKVRDQFYEEIADLGEQLNSLK
jgi:hypothetical protein